MQGKKPEPGIETTSAYWDERRVDRGAVYAVSWKGLKAHLAVVDVAARAGVGIR